MKKEIIGNILAETPLLWRCQIEKDEIGIAMESGPKIAAIVLQYGQWQKTLACVQSLIQGELVPHWIIVVDNASPDDSASQISCSLKKTVGNAYWQADSDCGPIPKEARVIFARLNKNRGYAAGNNLGLRMGLELGADAFLVLNNDTTLDRKAVGEMWKRLSTCHRPGLCGALIVYANGDGQVQCLGGGVTNYFTGLSTFSGAGLSLEEALKANQAQVEKDLNFICGACVMASRKFVEETGLMDEGYFLYCEEQDWAIRSSGRFDFAWAREAIVYHHEGATTGWNRFNFNLRGAWLLTRSRIRLTARHYPQYLPGVIACILFASLRLGARKLSAVLSSRRKK